MADGSYKYLLHKPSGPFLSRDFGDIVKDQYMPAIEPNRRIGANDMIDGKLIADAHLGVDVPVVRTITRTLGGRSNDPIEASRVDILDIGDAELDLSQNERVTDAKWVSADDLDTLNITGSLVDQLQGTEFKQILLDAERDAESPVTNANPGNEVVNEDNPNMARQWNNGRYNVTVYGENGAVGDDKIVARILVNGVNFGEVRKTYHGHYAATLLPTQGTRGVRNGSTVKAIFASETEAKDWLQMAVQKRVEPNNDQPINIFFGTLPRLMNANDRNATPIFKVTGGYLNPTTDEQRRLANRLIETKQTTPENRALYRAILAEQELSNGEVGWVIGNLINAEDRDAAEIEQSREGRNGGDGGGTPVGPTTAENNGGTGTGEGSIRAGELRAGQRLLGKYNADVAFVVPGENDTVNIGLIDSNGKLSIYKVNKNSVLPVSNRQDVNPPAVVNNPVVARNRQQVFAIQSAIRQAYPNARELPNGDFAVAQRDYRQADGTVFRYEAMVTKLDSDEFVSYVRQQQIDAQGNPIGDAKVAYLAEPGHSPRAVLNRLERQAMSVINSPVPANGFRQRGDIQNESVHPGHGQLVPESLVPNQNARYIGDTGIESTGNATKDALVGYMNNLIIRGMATPEIMEQLTRGNQNLFSKNQLEDILERLDANRMHPGVNIIPYVSRNKVIARVGDIIQHVDADGNVIKSGKVTGRRPITVNRKPNGEYVYTDQLYAKWDGLPGNSRQVAARRVIVLRRADGSEPTPAVISPNPDAPVNTPVIPDLPKQQGGNDSVVPDAIPNYDMLGLVNRVRVAEALQKVLSPDLRVSIDEDPESAKIQVRSEGRFVGAIRQLADGRYKAYFNDVNAMVYEENWDKLQDAIDFMKNGIGREFLNQRNNQQVDSAENDNRLLVDRNRELLRNKFDAGAEVIDGRTPTGNANIILWPMRPGSNKRATIRVGEDGMFEVRNWDSENGGDDTTFWATYDGALQRVREYLETDGGNEGGQEIDPIAIDAIYEHLNDYINYSVVPAPNHPVSLQVDSESGRQFAEWQGDVDDKKAHLWVNPTNGNIVATLWSNKNINSSKRDIEFTPAGIDRDSVQVSMIQAENEIQRFLNASPDDIEIVEPSEPSEQLDSPIIKGLISLQDSDLDRIAEENGRGQNYNLKKGLEPSSVLYYKTDANGNAITGEAEGSLFVTDGIVKMNFWEDGVLVSSETYKGEGNATDAIREMVSRVNARLTERGVTVNRVVGRGVTAKPNENQLYIDNKARFDSVVNGFEIPKVDGVDGVLADGAIVWYARPGLEQKRSVLKVDPATGYFYVTTSTDDAVRERYFETYEEAMSEINSFMSPRGGEVDAPVVAPEVPQGDVALPDGYSFSVDGDDIFTAGAADGGNGRMYAVGERGTDGQWSVRVHANARDAMRNQNALSTSTHATKEDAKRAVANELASRENPEPSAPILQWQDGSDGNPYIGLAGVAGIAPESAPILMVVPGPNGTWSVQMWRNQADFDAGRAPARSYDRPSKDDARQRAMEDAEALVALLGNSGN
jgi:hypothetical protein